MRVRVAQPDGGTRSVEIPILTLIEIALSTLRTHDYDDTPWIAT